MTSLFPLTANGRSNMSSHCCWSIHKPLEQESSCTHMIPLSKPATPVPKCRRHLVCCSRFCKKNVAVTGLQHHYAANWRSLQRVLAVKFSLQEKNTSITGHDKAQGSANTEDVSSRYFGKAFDQSKLEAMRADSIRSSLVKKLSEANQYNRHLKRQLYEKEDALKKYKAELAVMELELQTLVQFAEEVAKSSHKEGARKINGRYIHSHLQMRLEELHKKLLEQIKDVDAMESREVLLLWAGMAEDVKVMGSFDGWTQGEQMSPEPTGGFTKFSATLKLRPGRYEIKFLVDGEWQLSPQLPIVGEGFMTNNLITVK